MPFPTDFTKSWQTVDPTERLLIQITPHEQAGYSYVHLLEVVSGRVTETKRGFHNGHLDTMLETMLQSINSQVQLSELRWREIRPADVVIRKVLMPVPS